jgi:hypothetical protein
MNYFIFQHKICTFKDCHVILSRTKVYMVTKGSPLHKLLVLDLDCDLKSYCFFLNFFEVPEYSSFGSKHPSTNIITTHSSF